MKKFLSFMLTACMILSALMFSGMAVLAAPKPAVVPVTVATITPGDGQVTLTLTNARQDKVYAYTIMSAADAASTFSIYNGKSGNIPVDGFEPGMGFYLFTDEAIVPATNGEEINILIFECYPLEVVGQNAQLEDVYGYHIQGMQLLMTTPEAAIPLTLELIIEDKQFDGQNTATITSAMLIGATSGDDVSLATPYPEATFANNIVANDIEVLFSGSFTLTGTDSAKYSLTQPTGIKGNIVSDKAKAVIEKIQALPSPDKIVLSDEDVIVAARTSYNSLFDKEKEFVGDNNLNTLVGAEDALAVLKNIPETSNTPNTLDASVPILWWIILSLAAGALCVVTIQKEKLVRK